MKNKGTFREKLATIVVFIILGVQLIIYFFIAGALLWEAWFRTPADRERFAREWEERDERMELPESVKQEMRAKYELLQRDNIPDNEPTAP